MPFSKRDQTILADLEKAKSIFPDLGELLAFYEKVFQVPVCVQRSAGKGRKAGYWEKREIHLQSLENGSPQIRFEELGLQPSLF